MLAVAIGLGSVDMPVPSVAEWEWLNWKFPRPVLAGDTIYARWTLTQKRPPVGGASSSIVVWRVDVHTADGTLCAEGEVGAKVKRGVATSHPRAPDQPAPSTAGPRRRRRRSRPNGTAPEPPAAAASPTPVASPAPAAKPERTAGASRRRRRRRPAGSAAREEVHEPRAAPVIETVAAPVSSTAAPANKSRLGGVLRRLRGT